MSLGGNHLNRRVLDLLEEAGHVTACIFERELQLFDYRWTVVTAHRPDDAIRNALASLIYNTVPAGVRIKVGYAYPKRAV